MKSTKLKPQVLPHKVTVDPVIWQNKNTIFGWWQKEQGQHVLVQKIVHLTREYAQEVVHYFSHFTHPCMIPMDQLFCVALNEIYVDVIVQFKMTSVQDLKRPFFGEQASTRIGFPVYDIQWTCELAQALIELHKNKVVHNNLVANNLFWYKGQYMMGPPMLVANNYSAGNVIVDWRQVRELMKQYMVLPEKWYIEKSEFDAFGKHLIDVHKPKQVTLNKFIEFKQKHQAPIIGLHGTKKAGVTTMMKHMTDAKGYKKLIARNSCQSMKCAYTKCMPLTSPRRYRYDLGLSASVFCIGASNFFKKTLSKQVLLEAYDLMREHCEKLPVFICVTQMDLFEEEFKSMNLYPYLNLNYQEAIEATIDEEFVFRSDEKERNHISVLYCNATCKQQVRNMFSYMAEIVTKHHEVSFAHKSFFKPLREIWNWASARFYACDVQFNF